MGKTSQGGGSATPKGAASTLESNHKQREQRQLSQRFGLRMLPQGVRLASFEAKNDCLTAEVMLSNGAVSLGPIRFKVADAVADLALLKSLQFKDGDAAVLEELRRLDLRVMSELFRARC